MISAQGFAETRMIDTMKIGVRTGDEWSDDPGNFTYTFGEEVFCLVMDNKEGRETVDGSQYPVKAVEIMIPVDEVVDSTNVLKVYSRYGHILSAPILYRVLGSPVNRPGFQLIMAEQVL